MFSHSYCGTENITYLICHVILQDHMIKRFSDFMEGSSSLNVKTLPGLMAIDIVLAEIFLFYDMISRDHVFKGLCNFDGGSFS